MYSSTDGTVTAVDGLYQKYRDLGILYIATDFKLEESPTYIPYKYFYINEDENMYRIADEAEAVEDRQYYSATITQVTTDMTYDKNGVYLITA